jgi:hypothetical protein
VITLDEITPYKSYARSADGPSLGALGP